MGFSNITYGSLALVDVTPPGSPLLALVRTANREIEARVTLPTEDSDGTAISGITELAIALLPETTPNENPFDGIDAANLASYAEGNSGQSSTIFLVNEDAGTLKAARFSGLVIGSVYWVATAVKDES